MIDIENKIIEKVIDKIDINSIIDKIDIDLLTDKIAEKVADYIIKNKIINLDPINPINPINLFVPSVDPEPFIPDQVLMYGCTPTRYQITTSDTDKSDINSL